MNYTYPRKETKMPRNPAKKNPESKPVKPGSGPTQEKKKPEPKPKPTKDEADHKAKGAWTGHEQPAIESEPEYKFEREDGCRDAPSPPEEPPAPPVQVIERRIETVTVEIPLGEPPTIPPRVHVSLLLRRDHAKAFARLRQALRDKGAKAGDGKDTDKVKPVDTVPDVIRWLMDQIASA